MSDSSLENIGYCLEQMHNLSMEIQETEPYEPCEPLLRFISLEHHLHLELEAYAKNNKKLWIDRLFRR